MFYRESLLLGNKSTDKDHTSDMSEELPTSDLVDDLAELKKYEAQIAQIDEDYW